MLQEHDRYKRLSYAFSPRAFDKTLCLDTNTQTDGLLIDSQNCPFFPARSRERRDPSRCCCNYQRIVGPLGQNGRKGNRPHSIIIMHVCYLAYNTQIMQIT